MLTLNGEVNEVNWQIQDSTVLPYPVGITVDETGTLYVAGWKSNNVVRVSSDGTSMTQVLSCANGLDKPQALHYDVKTKQLKVANHTGTAFIFAVMMTTRR